MLYHNLHISHFWHCLCCIKGKKRTIFKTFLHNEEISHEAPMKSGGMGRFEIGCKGRRAIFNLKLAVRGDEPFSI